MAGKGKNTTYAQPASGRKTFMERMYKGSPFAGLDQASAIDPTNPNSPVKLGNDYLKSALTSGIVDTGDLAIGKVDLTYMGRGNSTIKPPDTHEGKEVVWKKPGDPANSYVPDLSSPGPGKTEGIDKNVDPEIKSTDIKPTFDPTRASVNTTSPSETGSRVYDGNLLGKDQPYGKSY